jgi:dipeptidyl-peptidase-4
MNSFITLACLWAAAAEPAKDAPLDTQFLRDYAETRGFLLGRPVQAKPTPDGKAVLFLRSEARKPRLSLYEFDVATGKARELLTPESLLKGAEETLSPEEKARRERMRISVGGFTSYQLSEDGSLILLSLSGKLYVYDRPSGRVRELKTGSGVLLDPKFSPDGKQVAYVRDYDVHVYDLAADKERRLTSGGTEKKPHGLAEFVAQEEMGRFSGYWWSPDSKFIAYEEYDTDGVEVWYVADPVHPEQAPLASFYPRPGKKNVSVRLGVIPVAGGETVWVQWDREKYEYLASVRWDKNGPLTMTIQNRLQNEIALLLIESANGRTTALLSEKDPNWISLHQDVPRWLPGDKGFLWISDLEKGLCLERRTSDGKGRELVAEDDGTFFGEFGGRIVSVDESAEQVFFSGAWQDATATHIFKKSIFKREAAKHLPYTEEPVEGQFNATFSRDHQVFVITGTEPDHLPTAKVFQAEGKRFKATALPSVAESPDFKPRVQFVPPKNRDRAFVSPNGPVGGFYCSIVRPTNFDENKKYPVVVDVYGGPGHVHVVSAMRNWLIPQWIADQGFIVVAIDNRGTPGRGYEWERSIYKRFGDIPLQDQVAGLQALGKKFPELDLTRVGIYGWSFGGYMSALAVLKRPDVFKAAVAGAPVTDWEDYDTHYTERYLGLPKDSPQAYKEASLLTYADKLERPLLIVHGTADDNVYFRHSLKLADALFRAGKDFEMLPLSGLTHQVPDPVVMERLYSRIARHFQKHLGAPK